MKRIWHNQIFLDCLFFPVLIIGVSILVSYVSVIVYTDSPGKYIQDEFNKQVGCAREAGFQFKQPLLRVRKEVYSPGQPDGLAYRFLNIVVIAPYASYETRAHELGHKIDWQMKRKGHPAFDKIKNLDDQNFANAVAEIILDQCRK